MINKTNINYVSILVVTHNHSQFIGKLLNSLQMFNYNNFYICDAASSDDTRNIIRTHGFSDKMLHKKQLEGFSKNNNDLIRHFKLDSEYYLLLNPDTYFDTDFLPSLLQKIKTNNKIGIIAPLLKYPDGGLQVTWKRFPSVATVLKKRLGMLKAVDEDQMPGPVIDWCLGACMLITSKLLKDNGNLLDERYRLYCEDIDICFEAKVKGFEVIGDKTTSIYHNLNEHSAKNVFSKYNWWNIVSILKFILKWNFKFFSRKSSNKEHLK